MNKLVDTLGKRFSGLANKTQSPAKADKLAEFAFLKDGRSKIGFLSQMDIFCDLTQEEMAKVERATRMSACEKGKVFYRPHETGEVLFLLKRGKVQLYRLANDGRKLIIGTIDPGTFFGEMSLIGQGMYNAFAEAIEDCLLCVMSRADVERLLVDDPRVALRILEAIGRRLMDSEMRLEELAFKSVPVRLASLLFRVAQHRGGQVEGLTHQDLADMIGTYRETATLVLNDLKAAGIIHIERKKIVVLDALRLQEIADS